MGPHPSQQQVGIQHAVWRLKQEVTRLQLFSLAFALHGECRILFPLSPIDLRGRGHAEILLQGLLVRRQVLLYRVHLQQPEVHVQGLGEAGQENNLHNIERGRQQLVGHLANVSPSQVGHLFKWKNNLKWVNELNRVQPVIMWLKPNWWCQW